MMERFQSKKKRGGTPRERSISGEISTLFLPIPVALVRSGPHTGTLLKAEYTSTAAPNRRQYASASRLMADKR
jgi:hypothetical protein